LAVPSIIMIHEERLQIIWAVSFIISGLVFALAFWFTPVIGVFAVLGYIILYVSLATAFLIVFREIEKLNEQAVDTLRAKEREIKDVIKELQKKYYKKKIDGDTYTRMTQEYEKELTELQVRIRNLKKK
jgi:membrane-bound ClpP family serine protease